MELSDGRWDTGRFFCTYILNTCSLPMSGPTFKAPFTCIFFSSPCLQGDLAWASLTRLAFRPNSRINPNFPFTMPDFRHRALNQQARFPSLFRQVLIMIFSGKCWGRAPLNFQGVGGEQSFTHQFILHQSLSLSAAPQKLRTGMLISLWILHGHRLLEIHSFCTDTFNSERTCSHSIFPCAEFPTLVYI